MTTSEWTVHENAGLTPLTLEPVLVERIWGAHDLSPWYSGDPGSKPIGEIWLTADTCKVSDGPDAGKTLAEVAEAAPDRFGDPRGEGFPLLIKLLFPKEKLSVQVHPDDAEAQALGMPRGKTECWYVLSADPGAQVALGFQEPMSQAQVKAAIEDGSLESKLRMLPVKAGDLVFVDAGTVHAIGPGMVVLETQQYSDTTYRLWDYGRPRELHVEAGTAVTKTTTKAGLVPPEAGKGWTRLVSCAYFAVDRFALSPAQAAPLESPDKLQILIALGEGCTLQSSAGEVPLPKAHAVVLPAGAASYSVRCAADGAQVVRVLQP